MEWFLAGGITGSFGSFLFFLYVLEESLNRDVPFYLWLGLILLAICDALFIVGSYGRYQKLKSEIGRDKH
ncbi:MAG: hypothetical protein JSW53_05615 [Candidatus Bathyarchaeota archaeon]|nr:MAG: hypothetical protein JSW53_05615 [Candidatus Bathyarchaeota archaeon]